MDDLRYKNRMEETGKTTRDEIAAQTGTLVAAVRHARPLVQMITNYVSMDIAANVLLAAGAAPAMVFAPEESPEFVRRASALVVNTGTLSAPGAQAMEVATIAARTHGVPWVLDPVGAGATKFRDDTISKLLRHRPAVIRGNASEIMAVARLAGLTQEAGAPRGVESTHETSQVEGLAQKTRTPWPVHGGGDGRRRYRDRRAQARAPRQRFAADDESHGARLRTDRLCRRVCGARRRPVHRDAERACRLCGRGRHGGGTGQGPGIVPHSVHRCALHAGRQ